MDRKKPVRVTYRIMHCSSQDKQYPVSELLFQSPDAKGWQTARFCAYPQTIVLQLVEPTIVRQIAVLSHQSKISTKIQIQTKLQDKQQWKRLGYMSLQSNTNTNYQTRQLRKVNINSVTSQYLRFTMHPNYVNNHNPFNQVGIISLCIYGDKVTSAGDDSYGGQRATTSQLDKNTLNKIRSLEVEKKQAIEQEDFDRAKYIKQQIQRIKSIGHSLMQLQQRKKIAIAKQNFQDAKILNQQIKKLRDSNGGGPNFTTRPSGSSSQYYRPIKQPEPVYAKQIESSVSPNTPIHQPKYSPKPPKKEMPKQNKPTYNDDQRPINVKNSDPYNNFEEQQEAVQQKGGQQDQLQPLTGQLRKHCYEHFGALNQQIFRHIFSKNHNYRQRGLQMARNQIAKSSVNKQQLARAILFVVKSLIDDKVNSVLLSCIQLFDMTLKKLKPPANSNNMQHIDFILEKLADYLGNNNEKTRITTQQVYSGLPNYQLTNRDVSYKALSTIGKRDKPPKILTGRLKMLSILVQSYQLGKNYENVIQYAVKYADDKNNEVRNCAINLIASISKQIGYGSMQGYLKNIRPQIMKAIEEKLDGPQMGDQRPVRKAQSRIVDRSQQKKPGQNYYETDNQFMEKNQTKQLPNSEYVCDFCDLFDKKLQNENYRDLHLFNACPMLTVCPQCKQALQVSGFTQHLMGQCPNSKYFKKCPRCKQAVHQRNYKAHVQSKQCLPAKPLAQANRCPLCHLDVEPGAEGWKVHMLQEGCDNNPRK